jgi:succinate dehydrogenase / fumarate reductase cytochrome b subunit
LILFTYALFFHFCNGIRHLVWDAGYGYEYPIVNQTAYLVIGASAGLTLLAWIVAIVARWGS